MDKSHPLYSLVERSREDSFFVGYYLTKLQGANGWSDKLLAAHVGCDPDRLHLLMLCRRPDPMEHEYEQHVRQIAEYVPCNEVLLKEFLEGRF
jgi:hypothetical protein